MASVVSTSIVQANSDSIINKTTYIEEKGILVIVNKDIPQNEFVASYDF